MKDPEIPHCIVTVISLSEVLDINYPNEVEDDQIDVDNHLILKGQLITITIPGSIIYAGHEFR